MSVVAPSFPRSSFGDDQPGATNRATSSVFEVDAGAPANALKGG